NFIAQTAKICKSARLSVTKVVLICTVRLAHERSEYDEHAMQKTTTLVTVMRDY
ncbi:hypothetical protein TSAR_015354, partial [Trichomalopsis sarcophagae]